MTTIRVLVANRPAGLAAAVCNAIGEEPDLEVVEVDGGEIDLLLCSGEMDADVVVVGTQGAVPGVAERLVDEYPQVGVVAVDLRRGNGLLYRLRPEAVPLPELLPDGLAAAVRIAAGGAR